MHVTLPEANLLSKSLLYIFNVFPGSPGSTKEQESASSPDDHDDFVLVPANIPSDQSCDSNCSERHRHAEYCE